MDPYERFCLRIPHVDSVELRFQEDERLTSARAALSSSLDAYLAKMEALLNEPIYPSVARCLKLSVSYFPYKAVVLGQEPYKETILPCVATAFAHKTNSECGFTPSVQVLSQFICAEDEDDDRLGDVANVLTCSYLLLPIGYLFTNVHPKSGLSDREKIVAESYFSEFLLNLILCTKIAKLPNITLVCMGDAPTRVAKSACSAISTQHSKGLRVRGIFLHNPAFVARSGTKLGDSQSVPHPHCQMLDDDLGVVCSGQANRYDLRLPPKWSKYTKRSLRMMGKFSASKRFFSFLRQGCFEAMCKQSIEQLRQGLAKLNMSSGSSKSGHEEMSFYEKDKRAKLTVMLENITNVTERFYKAVDKVEKMVESVSPGDFDLFKATHSTLVRQLSVVLAAYAGTYPALTSSKSYVDPSGNSVPPIVKKVNSGSASSGPSFNPSAMFGYVDDEPVSEQAPVSSASSSSSSSSSSSANSTASRIQAPPGYRDDSVRYTDDVVLFYPGWLSNWFMCDFEVRGVRYNCVEQYIMSQKARLFGDERSMGLIMASHNPSEQKQLGRGVANFSESRWRDVRFEIALEGLNAKFRSDNMLAELLRSTGTRTIAEASPTDRIWGIGLDVANTDAINRELWKGENLLGRALMDVRDSLERERAMASVNNSSSSSSRVQPSTSDTQSSDNDSLTGVEEYDDVDLTLLMLGGRTGASAVTEEPVEDTVGTGLTGTEIEEIIEA